MYRSCFAGIDIGSRMTKVVIIDDNDVLASHIVLTSPQQRKQANIVLTEALGQAGIVFSDLSYITATGYGRINVPFADRQVTEITCHARGIHHLLPTVKTVIDIGGQDSKGIKLEKGRPVDFVMNDRCAAGTGRFIEIIADSLGITIDDVGPLALKASSPASISSTCTIFAEQEVVTALAGGVPVENLLAGVLEAISVRTYRMLNRLKIEKEIAFTGGGARNTGLVSALENKLGTTLLVPPEPLVTGALGAALIARDTFKKAIEGGAPVVRSDQSLREVSFFNDD